MENIHSCSFVQIVPSFETSLLEWHRGHCSFVVFQCHIFGTSVLLCLKEETVLVRRTGSWVPGFAKVSSKLSFCWNPSHTFRIGSWRLKRLSSWLDDTDKVACFDLFQQRTTRHSSWPLFSSRKRFHREIWKFHCNWAMCQRNLTQDNSPDKEQCNASRKNFKTTCAEEPDQGTGGIGLLTHNFLLALLLGRMPHEGAFLISGSQTQNSLTPVRIVSERHSSSDCQSFDFVSTIHVMWSIWWQSIACASVAAETQYDCEDLKPKSRVAIDSVRSTFFL